MTFSPFRLACITLHRRASLIFLLDKDKVVIIAVLLVINIIYISLNFIHFFSCLGLCL